MSKKAPSLLISVSTILLIFFLIFPFNLTAKENPAGQSETSSLTGPYDKEMKNVFELIYENDFWRGGSGPGSTELFTKQYCPFLQNFLKKYKIKSVVDLGCGDWQFSKLIHWDGIDYRGFDIVSSVIEGNQKNYTRENIHFYCADGSQYELPKADLIIIKDVFQHWSNDAILQFLPKLKKYDYALIINDSAKTNSDIFIGHLRALNMQAPPFSLPGKEIFRFSNKQVWLWSQEK